MAIGDTWETESKPGKHSDGGGLFLDVRSATSASWLFVFTAPDGRRDEMGLGSRTKVTLDRARELRRIYTLDLGDGLNPKEMRAKEKAALAVPKVKALTVHELAKEKVHVIARKLKTESGRTAWVRSLSFKSIGEVANMNPADVTKAHIKPLLERLYAETPVLAEDIHQRLNKLLDWAREDERITTPNWVNPVKAVALTVDRGEHVSTPHPALPAFKVGKFLHDVRAVKWGRGAVRLALEWNILSATRCGEAAATDWSWIDWGNNCVIYPVEVMKMRRVHRVPLTARHLEILDELLDGRAPPEKGPLFSVCMKKAISTEGMRQVMWKIIGGKSITLHGFRSSFATWAREEVYPVTLPDGRVQRVRLYDEAMIEECLAHAVGGAVRNAYVRDDFLEVRRPLMEAWAAYCGIVQEAKVIPMRRAVKAA